MIALKFTKLAKRIVAGLVILAAIVLAAFAMKSATAVRNRPAATADLYSQKTGKTFALPSASESGSASSKTSVEKLGPVPSKRDSRYWLFFVDEQNGWFADDESLWRSTDGGRDWKLVFSSKDGTVAIFFSNRQVGWMERVSGGTYRTEDGGVTWAKLSTPISDPKGLIAGMHFLNDGQTGWLVGALYKPVSLQKMVAESPPNYLAESRDDGSNWFLYQRIVKTTDGGKVWEKQALRDDVGEIFSLNFSDHMHGVALGDNWVFFTRTGGRKWTAAVFDGNCVDPDFIKFPDSRPISVAFAESSLAWVSYNNGRVLKSSDGGATWCDLLQPEEVWRAGEHDAYFKKLYFTNDSKGWGLKANGSLFRTEDGGRTWSLVDLGGEKVSEVQFLKNHVLFVTQEELFRITF